MQERRSRARRRARGPRPAARAAQQALHHATSRAPSRPGCGSPAPRPCARARARPGCPPGGRPAGARGVEHDEPDADEGRSGGPCCARAARPPRRGRRARHDAQAERPLAERAAVRERLDPREVSVFQHEEPDASIRPGPSRRPPPCSRRARKIEANNQGSRRTPTRCSRAPARARGCRRSRPAAPAGCCPSPAPCPSGSGRCRLGGGSAHACFEKRAILPRSPLRTRFGQNGEPNARASRLTGKMGTSLVEFTGLGRVLRARCRRWPASPGRSRPVPPACSDPTAPARPRS